MPTPLFIVFEGGEGSGKSSQIRRLADTLQADGHEVFATHEPGATSVGKAIRELLLETDEAITPRSEALLFAADRAHHVDTQIKPNLADGRIVLCDRYIDSSIAYQGAGRTLPTAAVARLSEWATGRLLPELTVLLDISPTDGLGRAEKRRDFDRLEREQLDFHERVRQGFLKLAHANPHRYLVLDGTRPFDELSNDIAIEVRRRLAE